MDDPQDLVSVYQAENVTEAYFVKNLLLDEGIESFVSEENEPLAGLSIAQPDVLVPRAREMDARKIIEAYDRDRIRRAHRADWKCPKCGATVDGSLDFCDVCDTERPGAE